MKNSKQRDLILDIINSSYDHPTTYQIYSAARNSISNISLGTVYRNLNLLYDNNMIKKIHTNDDVDHYDKVEKWHNHFICDKCNSIYDIFDNNLKISFVDDNKVLNYNIIYNGICHKCLKEEDL